MLFWGTTDEDCLIVLGGRLKPPSLILGGKVMSPKRCRDLLQRADVELKRRRVTSSRVNKTEKATATVYMEPTL